VTPKTTWFQERVYAKLREVPKGKVTTYGDLARVLGTGPRAVGQAMRCNPYAPDVPCHRVVASDGGIGGFRGWLTGEPIDEKIALLQTEGLVILENKIRDFEKKRMRF
jgi:methylated-DNA-[protein]-cysteine S-methyltransferase